MLSSNSLYLEVFEEILCTSFLDIRQNSAVKLSSSGLSLDARLFITNSAWLLIINLLRFSVSSWVSVVGLCVWLFPSCLVSQSACAPSCRSHVSCKVFLQLLASFICTVFFFSLVISQLYRLLKGLSITEFSVFVSLTYSNLCLFLLLILNLLFSSSPSSLKYPRNTFFCFEIWIFLL